MKPRSFHIIIVAGLALALLSPMGANAEDLFSGQIQGFTCMISGRGCPVDNLDPHLMLESDFVLILGDGKYYLLPNVSREVKAKYYLQDVKVTGKVNEKYRAMMVTSLDVKAGNSYKTVWSAKMAREEQEEMGKRIKEMYSEH